MNSIELKFDQQPPLLSTIFATLLRSRPGFKSGSELPRIKAQWNQATINPKNFENYLACCGLPAEGALPLLYPHVIASRLHMNMLAHSVFPIKMLGSVHLRNHIIQHRKIKLDETFDIQAEITTERVGAKGLEFDFTTLLTSSDQRLWESISTYYVRGKFGNEDEASALAQMDELEQGSQIADWFVTNNLGKRYALITGDFNPIHMSKIMAKIFGFDRDLAHAFCVLATSIHHLPKVSGDEPVRLDVTFKGPVYLGNTVKLRNESKDNKQRFDLFCGENDRPSICGNLTNESSGTVLVK